MSERVRSLSRWKNDFKGKGPDNFTGQKGAVVCRYGKQENVSADIKTVKTVFASYF